ncbi:PTS system lichenan oligosaccharide-specific IIA component (Lac family) [Hydrogenispora ethanolica]|uniref:PTS system lichenan oligosaccharide-specific IIA component (Lac family) n=1 Tax=Hydrogenispora ethanolica TaxID=1082276 RepID=A0A4R1QUU6_HYDET|nr:PTS lactose/cellobiose transporter subunit IIA [Hydrogenispora ethanolica]TCL57698.1 PTS system lichenan oligosaccharide-specific IIA component (Lac family) [Hydrogenispora ethanolica]
MDYQAIVMQLIINGGNARSKSMEAIHLAKTGQIGEARALLEKAGEDLAKAHEVQAQLIQDEAAGNHREVTLLMVHAQDHLMNAMTVKDLALEMIDMYETIGR